MGILDGKVALITGAGSNVGREVARRFIVEGAQLVLCDRDTAPLQTLTMGGASVVVEERDLTAAAACEAMVTRAVDAFGRVDILCNTLGIDPPQALDLVRTSEADWDRILSVNLKAVFLSCRAVLPIMREARRGSIVSVASQGALLALPGMAAYGVSKAGVVQLMRQIAVDYGKEGIRANSVCPSGLELPSRDRLSVLAPEQMERRAETMRRVAPLGRVCTPSDVAEAMLFLASDASGFITGAAVPVEGGATSVLRF